MTTRKPREGKGKTSRPPDPIVDRRLMEHDLASIGRLLAEKEFASIEEANAFLQEALVNGTLPPAGPGTQLEEAQEIIHQALESSGKRRLQLARKALEISPDCADAYVLLAERMRDPQEARRLYEQGVQAGERAPLAHRGIHSGGRSLLGGARNASVHAGRLGLAQVLWVLNEQQEAIEHLQAMLTLNPHDNQGVRYLLTAWLVVTDNDASLEGLLAQYPDEWSASWAYTTALHIFRQKGSGRPADAALKKALQVNPHVPEYLLGVEPLPKEVPDYSSPGEPSDALNYLVEGGEGWRETVGAVEWLGRASSVSLSPLPREAGDVPRATWHSRLSGALTDGRMAPDAAHGS